MIWTETETNIMRDVFRFMRDNAPKLQNTPEYWEALTDQAGSILARYKDHDLALDMLVTACQYFEKQARKESMKESA